MGNSITYNDQEDPRRIFFITIFTLIIVAGAFFYLLQGDTYAYLSLFIYYPLYRWFVTRHSENNNERQKVLKIFHISLLIRILGVAIISLSSNSDYHFLHEDSLGYDILAKEFIRYIYGESDAWLTDPAAYRAKGFTVYMGMLYLLFDNSILAVVLGNAFLSSASATFLYLTGKRMFSEKTGLIAAYMVVFFLPSFILDARILKEALVFFLFSYGMFLLIQIQQKRKISLLFEFLITLVWLYFTRIYYSFFLIPGLLYIISVSYSTKQRIGGLAMTVIIVAAVIYQELQTPASVTLIAMTQTGWFRPTGYASVDSQTGAGALLGIAQNPTVLFGAIYRGIKFIFFKPIYFYIQGITLPGQHVIQQTLWSFVSGVVWILLPGIAWASYHSIRYLRKKTFVLYSILFIAVPFFGLKGMTFRYKMPIYVIVFLLAAYGFENRKNWLGLAPFYLLAVMIITLMMLDRKMGLLGLF